MASGHPHGRAPRPALKLFVSDSELTGEDSPFEAAGGLSPRMTLGEFYRTWFVPIVLQAEGRDAATVTSYDESLAWWQRLTGDPPLAGIDEFTIATFKSGLREANYRRGKTGRPRALGPFTIAKHLRQVRTVLKRVGPTHNPERPGKHLLDQVPHLRVERPRRAAPKRCFTIDEARQIVAATRHMPPPRQPRGRAIPPARWWRAFVLVLFYTGLRTGTALALRRSMLERRGEQVWLRVPVDIDKTGKPIDKLLHPIAARAVDALGAGDVIFPWPHWTRHLGNRHDHLQALAGVPRGRRLSPHAWRRTHGTEMAKLGAMHGRRIAQQTLAHDDEQTTREFYVDIEAELIAQLPDIDCPLGDPRQGQLFS